jgi:hypothetical protein
LVYLCAKIQFAKKMKKFFFTCVLFISVMSLSAQLSQHGPVVNGGIGIMNAKVDKSGNIWTDIENKSGLSVGYRLRFKKPAPQSFHFDLDINAGAKSVKRSTFLGKDGYGTDWWTPDVPLSDQYYFYSKLHYYASIGGTFNFSIVKNFSVGLGFEPTRYFYPNDDFMLYRNYDLPVVAKIAYNLKFVEIGITGKYGLFSVTELPRESKKGRFSDIQLSVFVPFRAR